MWHYSLDVEKVWYEYTKNPSMVTFYNAWRALRKSEIELSDEETEISLRTFFLISTIGGSLIVSIFHTIKKVYQARSKTKDKKERKETKTPEPKMLPLVVITFLCRMVISCFDLYVKYFLGTLLIVATLKLLVLQEGLIELSGYIIVSTFITEHIVVLLASFPTSFLLFCLNEEKEEVVANETPAQRSKNNQIDSQQATNLQTQTEGGKKEVKASETSQKKFFSQDTLLKQGMVFMLFSVYTFCLYPQVPALFTFSISLLNTISYGLRSQLCDFITDRILTSKGSHKKDEATKEASGSSPQQKKEQPRKGDTPK